MPINPLAGGPDDEDLQKKNKAVDEGSSTNVSNVGQSTNVSAAAPATQNSSGSFTNLNQYTEANKDQGAGLGGKLTQNVQNTANEGLNQLGQSQQEFGKAEEAAGVNPNDYSLDKVTGIAKNVLKDPTQLQQADIDAASSARTKAAAFQAGTDTGPKNLNDLTSYQTATGTLKTAQDKAGMTGTESGRETLLRDAFKRPDYSKGQSGLDQLLTQNVPENRQKFETLRTNLLGQYGLGNQETQAIQQAADKRSQVSQGTQQAAGNINQALWGTADQNQKGGVLGTYQNDLLSRPAALNAAQAGNITAGKQAIKDYISNNHISTLGMSPDQLADLIVQGQSGAGTATLANTMSNEDLAKINALNKLAGRDPNLVGDTALTSVDSNRFNANINPNYTAAQNQINQRVANLSQDVKTAATQATQGGLGQAYGRDITGQAGVNYAIGRVNKNMNNPAYDANENQKVVNALQGKLDQINQARGKYGLGDIHVFNDEIKPQADKIWNQMRDQIKQQYLSPFLTNHYSDAQASQIADKWVSDRQNLANQRDFRIAVETAGKVAAMYNKLQGLQDNPMQYVGNTQLNSTPTFNQTDYYAPVTLDTSSWPIGPNGKPMNPATINSYTPPGGTPTSGGGRMMT